MDSQFEQMVQVNIQGRVFVICTSLGMTDQTVIGYYTEVLQQAIASMLTDESTPADFHRLLTEQAEWLESEIKQLCESKQLDAPAAPPRKTDNLNEDGSEQSSKPLNADKKATGYVPEAKSMPERLKDRRAEMEHLLVNDCVTLKLVSPKQAKKLQRGLVGRDPEKAEAELVGQLRNALHEQIRKFIRKNNGGPWSTATLQTDVRMDITRTRTLRALVTLSRQLLNERQEWLSKTKSSLTGRFFGGRVKMDK
ncbi:MAG: hypothetical protein LC541_11300 [Candidatus Thiodiazotropha sp.]|nr:hypothetical protein [Candidatus Thiodiazotropha sp.]MCM8883861.1 hypothetical protein [Candidatus Thiodiazotropha sp.]MCM8919814.1 hypothetical protein [Candidatus Thiodiazotropha sp.]